VVPVPTAVASAAPDLSIASSAPASTPTSHALGEQVARVDRAQRALAGGNAVEAIQLVDEYDARFPNGSLSQEAAALRIEALLRQGRRQEASDLGTRFTASHPKSLYADKIRRLLEAP
jgi:outer membrane protein assembly factor BamD (BamD/ComL family)